MDRAHDKVEIVLRAATPRDLEAMFEMQADPQSNQMAGTKPRTREVFFNAWEKIFQDPGVNQRIILMRPDRGTDGHGGNSEGTIVGMISRFQSDGHDAVGYWIARAHWGQGIASRALEMFLKEETRRPLHATTDKGNAVSQHILRKHGFECVGHRFGEETDRYLAREIADFVLR